MIEINRLHGDDCTIGRLRYGDFQCFTLELPWRNNASSISCVPNGVYQAMKRLSPRTKKVVIELIDVPGRSNIQIHPGNYTSQIEGCILIGDSIKFLNSDDIPDVTNSTRTVTKLLQLLPEQFTITIR